MNTTKDNLKNTAIATVATLATASLAVAETQSVSELIDKIKSKDDKVRGAAWQSAGLLGVPAVKPLRCRYGDRPRRQTRVVESGALRWPPGC